MSEQVRPPAAAVDEADETTWTEDERQAQRVFNAYLLLTLPVIAGIMFFTGGFALLTGFEGESYYAGGKFDEHANGYQVAHWLPLGPGGVYVFGGFDAGKKRGLLTNWLPVALAGLSLLAFVVSCRAAYYVLTRRGKWRYKVLALCGLLAGLAAVCFSAALLLDLVLYCSWPVEPAAATGPAAGTFFSWYPTPA
jgi:hypothetical protein